MDWKAIEAMLNEEIKHIYEMMIRQTGSENIKKLAEAQSILIQLRERKFG